MNTIKAFMKAMKGELAGNPIMVFDWNKAAELIIENGLCDAEAGLKDDWEYTSGVIFQDNNFVMNDYTFLSSIWAEPQLKIGDKYYPCWTTDKDTGWDAKTKWPPSAQNIIKEVWYK